jgi:hypothetical protein
MATYSVAGTSPTLLAQTAPPLHFDDCPQSELGIAMPPGGATFMVICDGYGGALVFDTFTMDPKGSVGAFPGGPLAGAVTVAPDGDIAVAAAGGTFPGATFIGTYTAAGAALNTYQSSFVPNVMTNGLAWSANGTTLYAVLVDDNNPANATYSLRIIGDAAAPSVSLTGAARAIYGTPVSLSGTVMTGSAPPPAGAAVTVTRTARGGAKASFTTPTTAGGAFAVTDRTRLLPGRYTYTASYRGGSSPAVTVTVSPAPAAVAMDLHGSYATSRRGAIVYLLYHHSARVRATVTVTPKRPGECVVLRVQEFSRGSWQFRFATPCAALSVAGKAVASFAASRATVGHQYRVHAAFLPGRDTTVVSAQSAWQYLMTQT